MFMNNMPMSAKPISNVDIYTGDSAISACGKNVQEIELKLINELQDPSLPCKSGNILTKRISIYIKGDKFHVFKGPQADICLTSIAHIQKTHNMISRKLALLCRIKNTFHTKQGKHSTTAAFYHTWTIAAHSGAMQTNQSAFTTTKTC